MKVLCVDAFTEAKNGGNPAGVVFLDTALSETQMRETAAKVGYSETAFVKRVDDDNFTIRYFTPVEEVDLCGHATVAVFGAYYARGEIKDGRTYSLETNAGRISINIENGLTWMDMAAPREIRQLDDNECETLFSAFAIPNKYEKGLAPAIVTTGLPDIMMNVPDFDTLAAMKCDCAAITELSRKCGVTGVHAFTISAGEMHCRNFAPLYGIDEEAATGTSNGALTFYLYNRGRINANARNLFIQGEAMGKPSQIYTRLYDGEPVKIRVGGSAAVNRVIEV